MKNNKDITPGVDKFLPVNLDKQLAYKPDPLLRYQIDTLSEPIRRSTYAPPVNRKLNDSSGRIAASIAASLAVALLILATTAVLVHCSR